MFEPKLQNRTSSLYVSLHRLLFSGKGGGRPVSHRKGRRTVGDIGSQLVTTSGRRRPLFGRPPPPQTHLSSEEGYRTSGVDGESWTLTRRRHGSNRTVITRHVVRGSSEIRRGRGPRGLSRRDLFRVIVSRQDPSPGEVPKTRPTGPYSTVRTKVRTPCPWV